MKTITILEAATLDEAVDLYNRVFKPYVTGNIYKVTLTIQIPEEQDTNLEEKGEGKGQRKEKSQDEQEEVAQHNWW